MEVSAARIADAAATLGLTRRVRRWGPCPACAAEHTRHDDRPPISVVGGGKGWWCHACDRTGDAVDLASWLVLGRPGREAGPAFRQVVAALRGLVRVERSREVEPEREPERVDVLPALRACASPATQSGVAAWMRGRGIAESAPAGVLPTTWDATWWPRRWSATWRLVVPAFTGRGELASLQARAVTPVGDDEPKCRWPRGASATGLLFADPQYARPLLRGRPSEAERVLIVEGLTDYLTACSRLRAEGARTAVIGIASGSAAALRLLRVPEGLPIVVATDYDRAGEVYAELVAEALAPHPVRRFPWRRVAEAA